MLCGLFCALSVITTLPGTGIVITALLRELRVGVVVVEVGRAVEDCPEPHIDWGSVGGQIHSHACAGKEADVDQIGAADARRTDVEAVARRSIRACAPGEGG